MNLNNFGVSQSILTKLFFQSTWISDNFRLWSRISSERIDISKIREKLDQLQLLPRWAIKMVNFGPRTKKLLTCILTPLSFKHKASIAFFRNYAPVFTAQNMSPIVVSLWVPLHATSWHGKWNKRNVKNGESAVVSYQASLCRCPSIQSHCYMRLQITILNLLGLPTDTVLRSGKFPHEALISYWFKDI